MLFSCDLSGADRLGQTRDVSISPFSTTQLTNFFRLLLFQGAFIPTLSTSARAGKHEQIIGVPSFYKKGKGDWGKGWITNLATSKSPVFYVMFLSRGGVKTFRQNFPSLLKYSRARACSTPVKGPQISLLEVGGKDVQQRIVRPHAFPGVRGSPRKLMFAQYIFCAVLMYIKAETGFWASSRYGTSLVQGKGFSARVYISI